MTTSFQFARSPARPLACSRESSSPWFGRFALTVLLYNLGVILWGAYVRASGSGAGCGSNWPLCNGEVIPRAPAVQTLVEFSHRATSGLAMLLVVALLVWAWRGFSRGHPVRLAASLSLLFIITEALVGAGLVLFELVAHNASVARAWWMAAHLVNTFFLLAVLTLSWRWGSAPIQPRLAHPGRGAVWLLLAAALALLAMAASGGVAALGDTLYLAAAGADGSGQPLSPGAEFLIGLRVYHPFIAVAGAVGVALIAVALARARARRETRRWALAVALLLFVQLGLGVANVWLRAPIPMQLAHLALADAIWIGFVLLAAGVLEQREASIRVAPAAGAAPSPSPLARG